jgi:hypothetical protein
MRRHASARTAEPPEKGWKSLSSTARSQMARRPEPEGRNCLHEDDERPAEPVGQAAGSERRGEAERHGERGGERQRRRPEPERQR